MCLDLSLVAFPPCRAVVATFFIILLLISLGFWFDNCLANSLFGFFSILPAVSIPSIAVFTAPEMDPGCDALAG